MCGRDVGGGAQPFAIKPAADVSWEFLAQTLDCCFELQGQGHLVQIL